MSLRMRPVVLGLAACVASNVYAQGIVYVNGATGDDAWDGQCSTWDGGTCGPEATIQAAVDAAVDGDQVVIADGVYAGPVNRSTVSGYEIDPFVLALTRDGRCP